MSGSALGQRIQFPTAIPTNDATQSAAGMQAMPVANGAAGTAPVYSPSTAPVYSPGAAPPFSSAPTSSPIPGYAAPPSYGPGVAPGPTATFQGNIQPAPSWDPYGAPGAQPPNTLFPQDPCLPAESPYPTGTMEKMQRFLQRVGIDYVWMPGTAEHELGLNDVDLSATFAIPFLYNTETPLLVTPGFGFQLWNGPWTPDVPGQTYDAYLDFGWNPQVTPLLGSELGFRTGIYSDFKKFNGQSIRYQGHALAVLSFSPSVQVKAGVIYLDRKHIKMLPAGGIVWTPNSDVRFEFLFPNPKFAKRLTTYGNTDWWGYIRGEYGGGSWTISGEPSDYNDIRVGLGLEFDRFSGCNGLFEVGGAFERELYGQGTSVPVNTTVYVRSVFGY